VVGVGWVVGWLSRASLVLNGVAFRPLGGWLGSLDASSRRLGSLVATIAGAVVVAGVNGVCRVSLCIVCIVCLGMLFPTIVYV